MMKTYHFTHEPSFAELWNICVDSYWDRESFGEELSSLFGSLRVGPGASLLDVAAGGGFPAFELVARGYKMTCSDIAEDEKRVFEQEALRRKHTTVPYHLSSYEDLLKKVSPQSYNGLACRGNSFIYAVGGWNEQIKIDQKSSLQIYEKALSVFHDLLRQDGWLYIDKFKDVEVTHKTEVARIQIMNEPPETILFWTERDAEQKIRRASLLRRKEDGTEKGVPNMSYDLSESELIALMRQVGFKNIQRVHLASEQMYDAWIAQK